MLHRLAPSQMILWRSLEFKAQQNDLNIKKKSKRLITLRYVSRYSGIFTLVGVASSIYTMSFAEALMGATITIWA